MSFSLQQALLQQESSGDYSSVNPLNYIGGYQFGQLALETLGYLKSGTSQQHSGNSGLDSAMNWTGKNGVYSKDDFLNNPDVQDLAFQENLKFNHGVLSSNGTIDPDTPADKVSGYLAAAHLLGPNGAKNLTNVDANGTSGYDYFNLGVDAFNGSDILASVDNTQSIIDQANSLSATDAPPLRNVSDEVISNFFATQRQNPETSPRLANERAMLSGEIPGSDFFTSELPDTGPLPAKGLVEGFKRSLASGAETLLADTYMFGAAIDQLQGDEQGTLDSIANARITEELAAIPMQGLETFSEFWEEKTVEGFLDQVAQGTGQIVPSALTSIIGFFTGGGVASMGVALGKHILTQEARQLSKSLIKESIEAVA